MDNKYEELGNEAQEDSYEKFEYEFEEALIILKNGGKVTRRGWNGKNLWIRLCESTYVTYNNSPILNIERIFIIEGNSKVNSWVPSISDLLADDWQRVK